MLIFIVRFFLVSGVAKWGITPFVLAINIAVLPPEQLNQYRSSGEASLEKRPTGVIGWYVYSGLRSPLVVYAAGNTHSPISRTRYFKFQELQLRNAHRRVIFHPFFHFFRYVFIFTLWITDHLLSPSPRPKEELVIFIFALYSVRSMDGKLHQFLCGVCWLMRHYGAHKYSGPTCCGRVSRALHHVRQQACLMQRLVFKARYRDNSLGALHAHRLPSLAHLPCQVP